VCGLGGGGVLTSSANPVILVRGCVCDYEGARWLQRGFFALLTGKYGGAAGIGVVTCSGDCAAGYACPTASTVASPPAAMCASGRYAAAGATSCSDCVAGQFSTAPAGTGVCVASCAWLRVRVCHCGNIGADGMEVSIDTELLDGHFVWRTAPALSLCP
jgi:hypothetical protein